MRFLPISKSLALVVVLPTAAKLLSELALFNVQSQSGLPRQPARRHAKHLYGLGLVSGIPRNIFATLPGTSNKVFPKMSNDIIAFEKPLNSMIFVVFNAENRIFFSFDEFIHL
jgi:hypothetical protein